jgi:hypothetical protein
MSRRKLNGDSISVATDTGRGGAGLSVISSNPSLFFSSRAAQSKNLPVVNVNSSKFFTSDGRVNVSDLVSTNKFLSKSRKCNCNNKTIDSASTNDLGTELPLPVNDKPNYWWLWLIGGLLLGGFLKGKNK